MLTENVNLCDDVRMDDDGMKVETIVGLRMASAREARGMSQPELGRLLGEYLGKPWQRQAVSAAEKGARAFTAAELLALSFILRVPVEQLFKPPPEVSDYVLPAARINRRDLADATPRDDLDADARSDLDEALAEAIRASSAAGRATSKVHTLLRSMQALRDEVQP